MNVVFTPTAWEQYTDWQKEDKKIVKRINDQNLIIYSCKYHYEDQHLYVVLIFMEKSFLGIIEMGFREIDFFVFTFFKTDNNKENSVYRE